MSKILVDRDELEQIRGLIREPMLNVSWMRAEMKLEALLALPDVPTPPSSEPVVDLTEAREAVGRLIRAAWAVGWNSHRPEKTPAIIAVEVAVFAAFERAYTVRDAGGGEP